MSVARVVASYGGEPCAKQRPDDAPVRPGEPCGEVHEHCRGHVRSRTSPRYGDPCGASALPGILTCADHGGQLPESAAIVRQERARRLVQRITGAPPAIDDPAIDLARLVAEMRARRDVWWDMVDDIQVAGGDALSVEAGGEWIRDGIEGRHPKVTGDGLLVLNPSGAYKLHPMVERAEQLDLDLAKLLADMTRLGIEERMARLEEAQVDLALAAARRMIERMLEAHPELAAVLSPDDAMGLFLQGARDVDALEGTVSEAIEAHVVRTVEADDDTRGLLWPDS